MADEKKLNEEQLGGNIDEITQELTNETDEAADEAAEGAVTADEQDGTAGETPLGKDGKPKKPLSREILEWVLTLLAAVVIALPVRAFVFEPVRVEGNSMQDTLQNGEAMFVSKYDYLGKAPDQWDIVILHYPGRGSTNFVKRVVAMPGDTVSVAGGLVTVNGTTYQESYLTYRPDYTMREYVVPKKGDVLTYENGALYVNGVAWTWAHGYIAGKAADGTTLVYEYNQQDSRDVIRVNGRKVDSLGILEGKEFILQEDYFFCLGDHRNNSNDSHLVGPIPRHMIRGHVCAVIFPPSAWRTVE